MLTRILTAVALMAALTVSLRPALADTTPISDHALLMQLAARADSTDEKLVADDAKIAADRAVMADLRSTVAAQQAAIEQLKTQLTETNAHPDSAGLAHPDTSTYGPFTVSGKDVYLTGYNLHIVSGSGSTTGTVNGYGNLIIGYDESRGSGKDKRTGSHNLIVGDTANFTSYGGIIAGHENSILAPYASVTGGRSNQATAEYSSVSGGYTNFASAEYASVSGGEENTASGEYASISGGGDNAAVGTGSSAIGGVSSEAQGDYSLIGGGGSNVASGDYAICLGGAINYSSGYVASVFGGYQCTAAGDHSTVTGGVGNEADGSASSVSGGSDETESNDDYWKGGTYESE